MNYRYFTFISLFFLVCIGCNKEETQIKKLNEPNNEPKVVKLGQIIAKSLTDSDVSNFVQNEALKKFDGDNNFILALAYEKKVENNDNLKTARTTFLELLSSYSPDQNTGLKTANTKATNFLKEFEKEYPLMQIAIPEIYAESEQGIDFANKPPHVVILPTDYDEQTTKSLTVIDNNGGSYQIDANEPPEYPVIVISENERYIAVPKENSSVKKAKMPDYETDDYYYYDRENYYNFPKDWIDEGGHGSSGSQQNTPILYDRDKNDNPDNLYKAKFASLSDYKKCESWIKGKPEIKMIVVFSRGTEGSVQFETLTKYINKKFIKRKWFKRYVKEVELNIPMFIWDKDDIGSAVKYVFIEEDAGGSTREKKITYTNKILGAELKVETTIQYKSRDDLMGEALVQYKSSTNGDGTKHSTGIFEFWINQ